MINSIEIDYNALVETMAHLIEETKERSFERENEGGYKAEFRIHRISMSMIIQKDNVYTVEDGIFSKKETDTIRDFHVAIWVKNPKKISSAASCYRNVPADPEGFKMFFYKYIVTWVDNAFTKFASCKRQDNKYYLYKKQDAEVYVENIHVSEALSQETLDEVVKMSQRIYVQNRVTGNDMTLNKNFEIHLFVDSDGRKIVEKVRDNVAFTANVHMFNKNGYSFIFSVADTYCNENQLFESLKSNEASLLKQIEDRENILFLESGFYPILYAPETTTTLFHEAVAAHLLSGRYIANQESNMFARIGKNLIGENQMEDERFAALKQITLINEPENPDRLGSYKYDCEGIKSKNTVLLEHGIVKGYLHDLNSAHRLGSLSNGTSLSQDYIIETDNGPIARIPEPRISNLTVKTDSKKSLETLRKEMNTYCKRNKYPFYLEVHSRNGQVDVATGSFIIFIDHACVKYLDGTEKYIVGGTLAGDLFQFISSIRSFSKETKDNKGHCGAESGYILVHDRGPWMFAEVGINYVPESKPKKMDENYNVTRDKYIPPHYKEK